MKELPLYNGEAPQTPQVQVQKPGDIPALPMWGQNVSAAINAVGDALVKYGELEDYGTAAEIGRKRKELAARANKDFTEKARLPWGEDGSFYNRDGTRNEDEIRAFAAKWEEENEKLGTGRFWLRKNALRAAEEKEDFTVGFALEVDKNILKGEQENRERLFRDNYDLCVAKEDYAGAAAEVDRAVQGGMITKARGEAMKIRLAKAAAKGSGGGRGKGGIKVGDLTDAMLGSLVEGKKEEAADGKKEKKWMDVNVGEDGKLEAVGAEAAPELRITNYELRVGNSAAAPLREGDGDLTLRGEMEEPGKVEGGGLTEVGVASEAAEKPSMDELLKVTEEDLTLGRDPWDKPEVLKVGFGAMTPDEVEEQWMRLGTEAGRVRAVATDDGVGRLRLEIPEAAEEPMAAVAHAANAKGGMTLENYKKGAYATMCAVMTNPEFAGLSDEDMKKLMVGRVEIEGLEGQLFPDLAEEDRGPAMASLVNGIADNVLSTRGDNIRKRVDEFFAGAEGLPGATAVVKGLDDASIGALYQMSDDEKALQNVERRLMAKDRTQEGYDILPLWRKYGARFAAEEGVELITDKGEYNDIQNAVKFRRQFRDWYFREGGVMDERVKAYVEEAKWVCTQAGIDAVTEYRRNGGESWAEENEKMMDAIAKARKNLKGGGDIAAWREGRDAGVAARAAKYREQAEEYAPMLEEARKESEEAKAAKEAQAAAEKERKDWEEGKRKEAQRKVWDAELEAEAREAAPYRYPVVAAVQYAEGDKGEAAVTVSPEEYMKMLKDLKVGRGEGVVCTFGNGKKQVAVKPGKGVEGVKFNSAVIQLLYAGRKLTEEQLKAIVNEHNEELHFKKVIKGTIKI